MFLRVFFALYLILGLGFIALTPPFQSPDAFAHFDRAVGLARGDLLSTASRGTLGNSFPVGVYQTEVVFSGMAAAPDARVRAGEFAYGWRQTWHSPEYFTAYVTGGNAPFLYLPQVLGIEFGRLVSDRILVSYYGAELMNFLVFVTLMWWAIRRIPRRLAFALGIFLLLPMVTSLAISVNPDASLIALSGVFAAAWWQRRREATVPEAGISRAWDFWSDRYERVAALCLVLMTIEKPPLVLLGLLLPLAERPRRLDRYAARAFIVCASAGVLYEVWSHWSASTRGHTSSLSEIAPVLQFRLIVTHPWHDLVVVYETLRAYGGLYAREFTAGIGWLDTWFPSWFYWMMAAILAVATVHATSRVVRAERAWSLAVMLTTALALLFTFYIVDSPLGANIVTGFQGRYLLPLYPSLVVILGAPAVSTVPELVRSRATRLLDDYGAIGLVSVQLLVAAQFAMTLLNRYWF